MNITHWSQRHSKGCRLNTAHIIGTLAEIYFPISIYMARHVQDSSALTTAVNLTLSARGIKDNDWGFVSHSRPKASRIPLLSAAPIECGCRRKNPVCSLP